MAKTDEFEITLDHWGHWCLENLLDVFHRHLSLPWWADCVDACDATITTPAIATKSLKLKRCHRRSTQANAHGNPGPTMEESIICTLRPLPKIICYSQAAISWAVSSMKDMNGPTKTSNQTKIRGIKKKQNHHQYFKMLIFYIWLDLGDDSSPNQISRLQLPTTWLAIRETGSLEAIQGLGGWVEIIPRFPRWLGWCLYFLAYYVKEKKLYL